MSLIFAAATMLTILCYFYRHSYKHHGLAILMAAALSACANLAGTAPSLGGVVEQDVDSQLVEYSVEFKHARQSGTLRIEDTQLWFPSVTGNFFGTPNAEFSWSPKLDAEGRFTLPAQAMLVELAKLATPFDSRETALLVEPGDTRIARVTSFVLHQFDGEPLGDARWRDQHGGRKDWLLVYFDQACRVVGSVFVGEQEHRFDLQIPSPGLYWLSQKPSWFGPGKFVNHGSPKQPILAVGTGQ